MAYEEGMNIRYDSVQAVLKIRFRGKDYEIHRRFPTTRRLFAQARKIAESWDGRAKALDAESGALKVGDRVRIRSGSSIAGSRWHKRDLVGTVVAAEDIPGYGHGVKIKWPGEEIDRAFQDASHFDLVKPL